MSTAIKDIYLTLYGQEIDGLTFAIGSTVNWHLTLQQPTDLAPFNLTGANVVVALSKLDGRNNPITPPIVARQADVVSAVAGTALAEYVAADTYRTPALTPGLYGVEVWLTDSDGNRFASLPVGRVKLTGAAYAPGGDITPLPAQEPLAFGPGDAASVSYTPADASKWASTPPATAKVALDRLAAYLYTLGGNTPIP